ncbi:MAG: o-succinylbenzoate--CoA ligase [Nostocoides sp.]
MTAAELPASDRLRPLPVPAGPAVLGILSHLRQALKGGTALLPYAAGDASPALPVEIDPDHPGPDPDTALLMSTSGSTGAPKLAMLPAAALLASAEATHTALGGPGRWLLSMPGHHVAGMQVLIRSLVAGTTPSVMDLRGGFNAAAFVAATADLSAGHGRRYTAIVPTQLTRLLADPAGARALAAYDAVLVGGAGTPVALRQRAAEAGIDLVPTYGMTETSGGCVYAGRPLPGAQFSVGDPGTGTAGPERSAESRRIYLGGATLATGYLGRPDLTAACFSTGPDGTRWFRTDDAGHAVDGELQVDGRLDDLINTGGVKVAPRVIEDAVLRHLPEVAETVVVGIPDPQWGHVVAAAITLRDTGIDPPGLDLIRDRLSKHLPRYALPRRLLVLDHFPSRGPGKPDRAAIRERLIVEE